MTQQKRVGKRILYTATGVPTDGSSARRTYSYRNSRTHLEKKKSLELAQTNNNKNEVKEMSRWKNILSLTKERRKTIKKRKKKT